MNELFLLLFNCFKVWKREKDYLKNKFVVNYY